MPSDDERVGLRLSIALHVAVVAALETGGGSTEQRSRAVSAELVALPTQLPTPGGEQPTDATDDCAKSGRRPSTPGVKLDFKIAAAPLETALRDFGDETGLVYDLDARLLAYRWGSPVRGFYTPAEAADRLLDGTGLCADWVASGLIIKQCGRVGVARHKPSFGLRLTSATSPCGRIQG